MVGLGLTYLGMMAETPDSTESNLQENRMSFLVTVQAWTVVLHCVADIDTVGEESRGGIRRGYAHSIAGALKLLVVDELDPLLRIEALLDDHRGESDSHTADEGLWGLAMIGRRRTMLRRPYLVLVDIGGGSVSLSRRLPQKCTDFSAPGMFEPSRQTSCII